MASLKLTIFLAVVVAVLAVVSATPRYLASNDGQVDGGVIRVRRDDHYGGGHHGGYHKGRVGPVYTSVKTDEKANFKWSVKHKVGSQYAYGGH